MTLKSTDRDSAELSCAAIQIISTVCTDLVKVAGFGKFHPLLGQVHQDGGCEGLERETEERNDSSR
jgi:hypothetical protein